MILRPATASDAVGLTDCLRAAYAPFEHLGLPPVTEGIADDIRAHTVWVADIAGDVKGGIVIVLGDTAHIANLAVHPDAGGHGIGKALIAKAVALAQEAGHDTVQLATHIDMNDTQMFYRSLGWVETGREGKKVYFQTSTQ